MKGIGQPCPIPILPYVLGAVLLLAPIGLALGLRPGLGGAGAPAAPVAATSRASAPATPRFVLARQIGELAAGLAAEPHGQRILLTATLLGPDGGLAAGYHGWIVLSGTGGSVAGTATRCGRGCLRVSLPRLGVPRSARLTLARGAFGGGSADYPFPDRWPARDGAAILRRATATFRSLRSVVSDEVLSSGTGATLRTRFEEVAPDRMRYRIDNGAEAVVIGTTRWDRDSPSARWQVTRGIDRLSMPFLEWAGQPRDVSLLREGSLGGRPVSWLSFLDVASGMQIWFTVAIERSTSRLLDLVMVTAGHFMHDRYSRFDEPLAIRPPIAG